MRLGNMFIKSLKPECQSSTGFTTLKYHTGRSSDLPGGSAVKKQVVCKAGDVASSLGSGRKTPEKEMATPPVFCLGNTLTEEPGGLAIQAVAKDLDIT